VKIKLTTRKASLIFPKKAVNAIIGEVLPSGEISYA
jgi:hypothetical protein